MILLSVSLVLYENDFSLVNKVYKSFLTNSLDASLQILDNSIVTDFTGKFNHSRTSYQLSPKNIGFGRGHNVCIRKILDSSKYHLVLNPDISFPEGTLEKLYAFMESNPDVGLVVPKVLNYKSEIQNVYKRLPAPVDLILRRFGANLLTRLFKKQLDYYEMAEKDPNQIFEAPYLSGCFMFFRIEALKKVGLFDERFFLYMEDVDICRRMAQLYKNVYFPEVYIYHEHARQSYKLNRYLFVHIISAIKYFNKWGWFYDPDRKRINQNV